MAPQRSSRVDSGLDTAGRHRRAVGSVATKFEPVRMRLDSFLLADPEYSAQLCVFWRGEMVVNLSGGPLATEDAITGVFSVTKGVAALCLALLVQRNVLDLDAYVVEYWPEFGVLGKSDILVRELLSHQAGLVGIEGGLPLRDLTTRIGASMLAGIRPHWRRGGLHGYHALTLGVFMEELVRRTTGQSLQQMYRDEIREAREIDFFIGLPETEEDRYVPLQSVPLSHADHAEAEERAPSEHSLGGLAFGQLEADLGGMVLPNLKEVRRAGPAAVGGIGSAQGLAKVYAAAITGVSGPRMLTDETVSAVAQTQTSGPDLVIGVETSFAIGFMKPNARLPFGSHRAFGHDGMGGALGFADPTYDLGFGYIPFRMGARPGADAYSLELSRLARDCVAGR
jgi:CubicO group peptidase (beta-lactamase class C family)